MSTVSEGYSPPGSQIQQQVSQQGHANTLPFTGVDVGLMAGVGVLLAVVGVVLRRALARA